jgi:toxin-antitoxin system PIN domain toxin
MRSLLDVNVLIALLDPQNAGHSAAYIWLAANFSEGWASCPLTENACLRLLTNPRYRGAYVSPAVVLARMEETKRGGDHEFWPDDLSITDAAVFDWSRLQGHQQVTDIYLLALAVAHGGRLVTFDRRMQAEMVRGSRSEHLVTL